MAGKKAAPKKGAPKKGAMPMPMPFGKGGKKGC